jgi:hypothetical protein
LTAIISTSANAYGGALGIGLSHVIDAVSQPSLRWCVVELDAMGVPEIKPPVNEPVNLMSTAELRDLAGQITQTIDGLVIGFPEDTTNEALAPPDLNFRLFPTNRMCLAIWVSDSSRLYVVAKDKAVLEPLAKLFRQPKWHEPEAFF